jgi:hypothetical protein
MTVGMAVETTDVSRETRKVETKSARVMSRRWVTRQNLTGSLGFERLTPTFHLI